MSPPGNTPKLSPALETTRRTYERFHTACKELRDAQAIVKALRIAKKQAAVALDEAIGAQTGKKPAGLFD